MHNFTEILKKELICALGCTEPIALAFASSKARELLEEKPVSIDVYCSGNIIKNVKSVTVPNTKGMKGIEAAVAVGAVGGDSSLGLEVLSNLTKDNLEEAKRLIEKGVIKVFLKEGIENLDIDILMKGENNQVEVEIKNKHTSIVKLKKNGASIIEDLNEELVDDGELYKDMTLKTIFDYANTVPIEEVREMIERQIELNSNISKEGLEHPWGSSIGAIILSEDNSLRNRAKAKAAAGSDARMSGCSMPVVINAGSGNQGMTCSLPVIEYANDLKSTREDLVRALLISNLTALHIKRYIGRLSAFCGVTSAGSGAAAGIAYLETHDYEIVEKTVGNTLMICSGMICDGAKPSCAAKIASAVDAGLTALTMAKTGRSFAPGDGLLKNNIEDTIRSIGHVAKEGMKQTDIEVLNKMLEKI